MIIIILIYNFRRIIVDKPHNMNTILLNEKIIKDDVDNYYHKLRKNKQIKIII